MVGGVAPAVTPPGKLVGQLRPQAVTIMNGVGKSNIPQAGPGSSGESRPAASAAGCPSYLGGAPTVSRLRPCSEEECTYSVNRCVGEESTAPETAGIVVNSVKEGTVHSVDTKEDEAKSSSNKLHNIMQLREPRVSLERIDIESDSSAVSMRSADSHRSDKSRFWSRKRCHGSGATSDSDGKEEEAPEPKVPTGRARRGRGRPPTTGEYVGKAKFQEAFRKVKKQQEKKELQIEAEKEISELTAKARSSRTSTETRLAVKQAMEENETVDGLLKRVQTGLALVQKVNKKSGHLQGPMQAALKEAVVIISAATNILASRTVSEEVHDLQAQNDVLRAEIDEMKREMGELKAQLRAKAPTKETQEETTPSNMEEWAAKIMGVMTARINARVEGLEPRLNPEPRLRPPLSFEKRREEAPLQPPVSNPTTTKQTARGSVTERVADQPPSVSSNPKTEEAKKGKKRKQKKGKASKAPPTATAPPVPRPLPPAPTSMNEGWSTVAKRGKTNGKEEKKAPIRGQKKAAKAAVPKARPPKSAAVVLSIQPAGSEKGATYEKAITEAKRRVDIAELGIEAVRFRRALTGATIIEVPGAASDEKADALADKLRAIYNEEEIRVSRPTKCSELRVAGLDDSVTPEEVAAAVAKLGGCSVEAVKVGGLRRDYTGLFATWVRCPVLAAKKVNEGRLLVGWVAARVRLLPNRELRCFRCLEAGHVQAVCPADVDRSRQCFRCGQLGHVAAKCENEPHCTLCALADKPAGHRVGSKACKAPGTKIGRRAAASAKGQPKPSSPTGPEETQMAGE
ncbi:uncharacterized protein LOC135071971 [Ostrinia nubilalis]|uniref:uncharacterized protein LOC135071971 n=1 Tax=Ostrinia nubilalis TaxID=29057 RepID=UPI00308226D0